MARSYSRILVTGGAGFIGGHIVDRLLSEGFSVRIIDNFDNTSFDSISHHRDQKEFELLRGDIRDSKTAAESMKDVDAVFHEAALASVVLSVKDPVLANAINVTGTLNVLKASLDSGVKRFIFASSAAVYGGGLPFRKRENLKESPTSPYGVSKLAAEKYVETFHNLYGLETVSLRYFNVYGPGQRIDAECAYSGVITIFLDRLLKNLPPIIYGDGKQTRDFVYIQDVVEANILALKKKSAVGGVFNIGSGTRVAINEIAVLLKQLTRKEDIKNLYFDPRPADVRHGYADISKARRLLAYNPLYSAREGLTKLVEWYVRNRNLVKREDNAVRTHTSRYVKS
jgi:nucleoside-diphosphate-sugar epimerase